MYVIKPGKSRFVCAFVCMRNNPMVLQNDQMQHHYSLQIKYAARSLINSRAAILMQLSASPRLIHLVHNPHRLPLHLLRSVDIPTRGDLEALVAQTALDLLRVHAELAQFSSMGMA